ncbi:MAG TPA: DUF4399 domain-containing protein [Gammaproteobacteria bacterium]|nr:rod shape-determining protein RodA [Chromatiales bacterium]MCP4926761.1 DUF4399 domain-containing protein [Gammaproteobacteria bacterium]HJP37542.1 DUF4399 domain-containing protein [Gammaproteobacteria bacterium]
MTARPTSILISILFLLLTGCGGGDSSPGNSTANNDSASNTVARSSSAPGATVFIISPINGSTISSPATVKFGISGMTVTPAGQFADNSGHHHLLVDSGLENPDQPIPSDAGHLHFGKGQTETTIELEAGQHTMQLVLGDGSHIPHEPPIMSDIVTITVE